MSAIDSELKSGRPMEIGWPVVFWSACGLAGLVLAGAGLVASAWWMIAGAIIVMVSGIALLDLYKFVNVRQGFRSSDAVIHLRLEAYYKRGQELYYGLAEDPTIEADEVRKFVADEWVNPTTAYLRGTLGETKATYFLSIRRTKPDEAMVGQFGYKKALARKRIMLRLERLRKIASEI